MFWRLSMFGGAKVRKSRRSQKQNAAKPGFDLENRLRWSRERALRIFILRCSHPPEFGVTLQYIKVLL